MTPQDAIAWLADIFEEPPSNLTPVSARTDIPAWDSLGVLTLMARLDEDFGILLVEGELQALKSVGDVLDLLRRHGHLNGAAAA
jgi:acyl carrier protein